MRNLPVSWKPVAAVGVAGLAALGPSSADTDPFQWLEDVNGEKAMAWVKQQNAKALAVLEARPEYKPIYAP